MGINVTDPIDLGFDMGSDLEKQPVKHSALTNECQVQIDVKQIPLGKQSINHDYNVEICTFDQASQLLKKSGLYQIFTNDEIPLKVGIAKELRTRITHHAKSSQKYLKFKHDGTELKPCNVRSARSILAKHLYFDSSISKDYDLKTEEGRREFLKAECYIKIIYTVSREAARDLERIFEAKRIFRYQGMVIQR